MTSRNGQNSTLRPSRRLMFTLALFLAFGFLFWTAGRSGLGSLRTARAARAGTVADGEAAIALSPNDADAHAVRAALFEINGELPAAIREYSAAASLRPEDYVLWLTLARASELSGDQPGAVSAARRALPLAPYYAQPHWQLGQLLIRVGQTEEGFRELRVAGASNPAMLPGIIDLAWRLSGGNPSVLIQTIQPATAEAFLALANFLTKQHAVTEAIEMLRATGGAGESARRQYLLDLIAARDFKHAFSLWEAGHPGNAAGVLVDSGFEKEQALDDPGFGWRTDYRPASVSLSLDPEAAAEGRFSLRVDFNGESDPGRTIISQLVLIERSSHYQVRFKSHADELVTGGAPNVVVLDAADGHVLGQSGPLPQTASAWLERSIDFVTGDTTAAVQISLQRNRCSNSQCPVFGKLWLDGFWLQKK